MAHNIYREGKTKVKEEVEDLEENDSDQETFDLDKQHNSFLNCLCDMWDKGTLCDVNLIVDKFTFRAHKVVLSAYSAYFRQVFTNSSTSHTQSRVPLLGIKPDVVRQLLSAIYHGKITLSTKTVDDILTAASYLKISAVVNICGTYLHQRLNVDKCLRTIQVAHMYGLPDLLEKAYSVACANFSVISKMDKFKRMRYCEVQAMLHRQDIVVGSELEVFQAVVAWLDADRPTRTTYAGRLMRHVRFPLISENDLVDKVENCPSIEGVPEVLELAREAVRYHLLVYRRSILQSNRTIPRSTYKEDLVICSGGLRDKTDNESMKHIYCYSEKKDDWLPFAVLPEARHHHAVAAIGGFMYVAGGSDSEDCAKASSKAWRYDCWTHEWLQIANMNCARQSFQLGVLDYKLYAVGGRGNIHDALSDVESYDPATNIWTRLGSINSARRHVAVCSLNGCLYAVGGSSSDMISRRVERFHPMTGKWEKRHPLTRPRFSGSLKSIKNRLWLMGGATVGENDPGRGVTGIYDIETYSVSADQWTVVTRKLHIGKGPMQFLEDGFDDWDELETKDRYAEEDVLYEHGIMVPRAESGSCVLNDRVYLVAGYSWNNRERLDTVECVDVSKLTLRAWTADHYGNKRRTKKKTTNNGETLTQSTEKCCSVLVKPYPVKCAGIATCCITVYSPADPNLSFGCLEKSKPKAIRQRPYTVMNHSSAMSRNAVSVLPGISEGCQITAKSSPQNSLIGLHRTLKSILNLNDTYNLEDKITELENIEYPFEDHKEVNASDFINNRKKSSQNEFICHETFPSASDKLNFNVLYTAPENSTFREDEKDAAMKTSNSIFLTE